MIDIVNGDVYKWISAQSLKSILNSLPQDVDVVVNTIGNLNIYQANLWLGYIDISIEQFVSTKKQE